MRGGLARRPPPELCPSYRPSGAPFAVRGRDRVPKIALSASIGVSTALRLAPGYLEGRRCAALVPRAVPHEPTTGRPRGRA